MARRIFRTVAVQRYNNRLEKIVLPRYASPPWVLILLALCGLLLTVTALLWAAPIPSYVTGPGAVIQAPVWVGTPNGAMVAAFLPEASVAEVRVTQRAFLQFSSLNVGAPEGEVASMVAVVLPEVISPAVARARYGLDASTGLLIDGPVVVALIPLEAPVARLLGSVGEVKIEVGSQNGLMALLGIGRFFAGATTP